MFQSSVRKLAENSIVRRFADAGLARYARQRTLKLDAMDVGRVQELTLLQLVGYAKDTRFGTDHAFRHIRTIRDYQKAVPLRYYEDFWKDYWEAKYPDIQGQTWPDKIPYYALSSGTTSGATKYIPISRQMLSSNRKAGFTTLALYRNLYPKADLFGGRFFFLGGSTDMTRQSDGSFAGDLSAISGLELPEAIKGYYFPPRDISDIKEWEVKARKLAEAGSRERISAISGVPAWILVILDQLKKVTGKDNIREIWPHLNLVIHGGTRFDPYREIFAREFGTQGVRFLETYPCSEGFVATEDPRYNLLRLVPDHGIFFEFVPVSLDKDGMKLDTATRHTVREIEVGQQYAVVLTTCAGLWSYVVGDTVVFEKKNPPLLRFSGRTKFFLSAFGEHLISEEIAKGIAEAASASECEVGDYHVGPVFPSKPDVPGYHRYLVEFVRPPIDPTKFTRVLDAALSRINEDYAAHRKNDLSMLMPEVLSIERGAFLEWRLARGGRAEQGKVPTMDNTGKLTETIREWMASHGKLI